MSSDAIVFTGLMPHAPLLVPSVAKELHAHVAHTLQAMTKIARHAVAAQPDTVLLVSPHSPRHAGAFGIWQTPLLSGSFEHFGSDENRVDLPLDLPFADRLEKEARQRGLRTWRITNESLDHGATVPLSYLMSAGWKGPTVVVNLNDPGKGGLDELGQAISATAEGLHRRLAIIASGDMSHRLTVSAPCGFHVDGGRFDHAFINLLRNGAPNDIRRLDPIMVGNAAEDAVDSTRVALATTSFETPGRTVISYEGPFGVGYGVAILYERKRSASTIEPDEESVPRTVLSHRADLPSVARWAVSSQFKHGPEIPPFEVAGELAESHGAFVTLRTLRDELRGCRGTSTPDQRDLVWQTWQQARAAAFQDTRFPPLRAEELARVRFTVSILSVLEPVASSANLNPALYGILVTAADGREGLMLPGIKGIDSASDQLRLAKHKAGIRPEESVRIQRFTAQVFQESLPLDDDED